MSLNNYISKDDENFLKEFLKNFYRQIIKIEYCTKFENSLTEWIQNYLNYNEKNSEIILKLMENHEENENWFSSIIGFFYDYEINICKDEINTMEKYFESLDKGFSENQKDYVKMKELMELNNLQIYRF
ncbi:hypothetical protein C1645_819850 [Glomus cerebriforme]|uniref:Uncharacterized protein n=1 Tax=Glomus cerebriforme TaxID=658196 RepID=A0A397T5J7_9GLOM|nr:hypothetical protein C1645_819850 [Glomus cerebriforme]